MNHRIVRGTLGAALVLLVACAPSGSHETGPVGSIVLPLEALGSDGINLYRLIGVLTITRDTDGEGGEPPVEIASLRARNSSPPELVEVLPVGSGYTITLEEDDEIRKVLPDGSTERVPEAVLTDVRTKSFEIGTEPTVVTYTYEIGGVPLGFGELEVRIDVIEEATCPCWNGTPGVSAPCADGPCRSAEEAYVTYGPTNCDRFDTCFVDFNIGGNISTLAQCVADDGQGVDLAAATTGDSRRFCSVGRLSPTDPPAFSASDLEPAQLEACRGDIISFMGVGDEPGRTQPCDLPRVSPDADGDGFRVDEGDCNDADVEVFPGAIEIVGDGIDNDCDGVTDEVESSNVILSEDFESLPLGPFITEEGGDGTDWTDVPPDGWSRDNTTTPVGDPSEFLGWTFLDEASWLAVAVQRRDEFTLGEGTIAVADPDEYDDVVNIIPNLFNAFLLSPEVDLTGVDGSTLRLQFDSSFRQNFQDDLARVEVSYDGGTSYQRVLEYNAGNTTDADRINETVVIDLDAGSAASVIIRWGLLDADNDWWWAIDNVVLSAATE